ncbi:proline-, glutamic acid- and leucine-rich protein 1 isoform X1 [Hydra vulgaris]|uniref:proline-, glutamic acid- and leucine-rich protein 1 isoform X1 n=1 Tax=Hydra vulgaris TaxID=6087 RepID=UPI001F5F6C7B|nr:proline-, glutamic acid- and leucine-rich protein 1 [Hydra vulgaris]
MKHTILRSALVGKEVKRLLTIFTLNRQNNMDATRQNIQVIEKIKCSDQIRKNDLEEVLCNIKELLNSKDKWQQWQGICLLKVTLKKTGNDILGDYTLLWIRQITQVLNTIPAKNVLKVCFYILIDLLKRSVVFDKLSREIALNVVEPLLKIVLEPSLDIICETFELISICIQYYPAACGQYYTTIEMVIVTVLFSQNESLSASACTCFPLLALCGSGGERRIKQAERYELLFKRVLKTILDLTLKCSDHLMGKERQLFGESDIKLIDFEPSVYNGDAVVLYSSLRLTRLLYVVNAFVMQPVSFKIDIPINHLMTIFTSVAELMHVPTNETQQRLGVDASFSKIFNGLLKCIVNSVHQFSSLLLSYSSVILKVILIGFSRDSCIVNTYECFGMIFTKWKGVASKTSFIENILKYVIADIKFDKPEKVVVNDESSKKRNKGKTLSQMIQKELNCITHQENATFLQEQKAFSALKLLEIILNNSGSILEVGCIKLIIARIFSIIQVIYSINNTYGTIYENKYVRKMVFQIAYALLNLNHHLLNVPVSILLTIFQKGVNDKYSLVSEYCQTCLLMCDAIIHSSNPSFCKESLESNLFKDLATNTFQTALETERFSIQFQKELQKEQVNNEQTPKVQESIKSCELLKKNDTLTIDDIQYSAMLSDNLHQNKEVSKEANDKNLNIVVVDSSDEENNNLQNHTMLIDKSSENNIKFEFSNEKNNSEITLAARKRGHHSEDHECNPIAKKITISKQFDNDPVTSNESDEFKEILCDFYIE